MTIPSAVLGTDQEQPPYKLDPIINDARYQPIRNLRITPLFGGNALAFGSYARGTQEERLVNDVFKKWKFTSWRQQEQRERPVAAGFWNDALGALARQRQMMTIVLSAPQRNLRIEEDPQNRADRLRVSGFEERKFKDFKIIGVS